MAYTEYETLDWLICGGESGPGARPCDLAWLGSLREQCAAAGVPYFCKQLGAVWAREQRQLGAQAARAATTSDASHYLPGFDARTTLDRHGGDPATWPPSLQVRQWPAGVTA